MPPRLLELVEESSLAKSSLSAIINKTTRFLVIKQISSFQFRSAEGLTLETSAFHIVHGGNSTCINTFDKTKFRVSSD